MQQCVITGKPMMPSIPKIQRLIESAWEKGFDKQGCDQLGGRVFNTTKWIGATEIVATLASLKVRYGEFYGKSRSVNTVRIVNMFGVLRPINSISVI